MAISGIPVEVFSHVPGFKSILKAIIKNQIQILADQLASQTGEQSVILTADIGENSFSQLGSHDATDFLENIQSVQTDFLKHCLAKSKARHHDQLNSISTGAETEKKKRPSPKKTRNAETYNKTDKFATEPKGSTPRKRRKTTEKKKINEADNKVKRHSKTDGSTTRQHIEDQISNQQLKGEIHASVLNHETESKGDKSSIVNYEIGAKGDNSSVPSYEMGAKGDNSSGLNYEIRTKGAKSGLPDDSSGLDLANDGDTARLYAYHETDKSDVHQSSTTLLLSVSLENSVADNDNTVGILDNQTCDNLKLETEPKDADCADLEHRETEKKEPVLESKSAGSGRKPASGKPLDSDMRTSIILQVINEGGDRTSGDVPRGVFTRVSKNLSINTSSVSRIWERYVNDGTIKPRQPSAKR